MVGKQLAEASSCLFFHFNEKTINRYGKTVDAKTGISMISV